jgi:hypothetical protein
MIFLFAVGILIRSVPNLIANSPIGYDTIYYATQILDWRNSLANPNIVFQTPLHLILLGPVYALTGADPFALLGMTQPLLYGLLSVSFYYAARRLLKWETKWALLATLIFQLQTVTLRISWDLLRNELGLAILLFTLPMLKDINNRPLTFAFLSFLVVLSHQTTTILLFTIIAYNLITQFRKHEYGDIKRLVLCSLPAALLFTGVLANSTGLLVIPFTEGPSIFPKTVSLAETPKIFLNYLAGDDYVNYNQSYISLLTDVISLYTASFILILPLVIKGTKTLREGSIAVWTGFCAFASLMCLASPSYALLLWYRWMQLLIVPYAFFATNGICRISEDRRFRISRKKLAISACLIYAVVAALYLVTPYTNPISTYAAISPSSKYSTSTMLSNTVPAEDTLSVKEALQWISQNMGTNSCLLTRDVFFNWAKLYLNKDDTIVYYRNRDVSVGIELAESHNFGIIYWIWWTENGIGLKWYGQSVPTGFSQIYRTGNIVIYRYQ